MTEGYNWSYKIESGIRDQNLHLMRWGAYMTYLNMPRRKGCRALTVEKFYPLETDKKREKGKPLDEVLKLTEKFPDRI